MKKILLSLFFAISIQQVAAQEAKPWTILIYIAGDNDLEIFIDSNIAGMKKVGSNENCNIVVCVARREGAKRTKTLTYILIEKNKQRVLLKKTLDHMIDSGQEETLRIFCTYAIENFPADNYGLILWDHGTGPVDPGRGGSYKVSDTFSLFSRYAHYPATILPAMSLILKPEELHKAICFDDTTGNYLTERKLKLALNVICNTVLQGKKFGFIGFDACLMANIEIASLLKNYAHYMIASQEIEPGAGWNYEKVFGIFTKKAPTALDVGKHIVRCYKNYYSFAQDLTLSCINLDYYEEAEKTLTNLIEFLNTTHLTYQEMLIKSILRTSSHKKNCTHFDEPEYIDMIHFLENLLYNFQKASIKKEGTEYPTLKHDAEKLILKTITDLQRAIVANTSGQDFVKATGLSIYFPTHTMNKLYKKNIFCCTTQWAQLLHNCL